MYIIACRRKTLVGMHRTSLNTEAAHKESSQSMTPI